MKATIVMLAMFCACAPAIAQDSKSFDAAGAFGARPSKSDAFLRQNFGM